MTQSVRSGFQYQYSYDANQRMTQRVLPFSDNQTQTDTYTYTSLEGTAHFKPVDYRPRSKTSTVGGQPLNKTYMSFFFNPQGEYVQRTEEAITPASTYGNPNNRRTEVTYIGTGVHKGRMKSILTGSGTLTTYAYQNLPANHFQITTLSRLVSNGQPFEGKSQRTVSTRDSRGWELESVSGVFTGGQWVDYERMVSDYNNQGRLIKKTRYDLLSSQIRILLEQEWDGYYLTRTIDAHGVATSMTYNQVGIMTSSTRDAIPAQGNAPAQEAITTSYNGSFQMTSGRMPSWKSRTATTSAGNLTLTSQEIFDPEGRIISQTDTNGYTSTLAYSDNNLVTTSTQPNGAITISTSAPDGRHLSTTGNAVIPQFMTYAPAGADGGIITTSFTGIPNSTRFVESTTDALGRTKQMRRPSFTGTDHLTQYFYNATVYCGPSVVTRTDQPTQITEYDLLCNPIRSGQSIDDNPLTLNSATDRISDQDTLAVFQSGTLWSVSTSIIYPDAGSAAPKQTSESRSLIAGLIGDQYQISEQRDIVGNLTRSVNTLNRTTRLSTTITDVPQAASNHLSIAHAHRSTFSQEAGESQLAITGYDALGRAVSQKDPRHSNTTTTTYQAGTSLVTSVTDAAGHTTQLAYGAQGSPGAGQTVLVARPNGTTLRTEFDLLNRQIRSWGTATYPKEYSYNLYGDMITLTTFRNTGSANLNAATWPLAVVSGDSTTWDYHIPTGLMEQKIYPDGQGPSYEYFVDGQLARRTWARGIITDYSYTAFDQLASTNYSNEPVAGTTPNVSVTYDRIGRPLTSTQGAGSAQNTMSYSYRASDLLLDSETRSLFGGQFARSLQRDYDALLRQNNLQLKNATTVEHNLAYGYLPEGQLGSVTSSAGTFTYSYQAENRALRATCAGPIFTTTCQYEANRNVLVSHQHRRNSNNSLVSGQAYQVDALGRRSQVTETGDAFATSGQNLQWAYNTRDELISATHSTDATQNRGYQFDAIGNRQSATEGSGGAALTQNYSSNGLNQYTAIGSLVPAHDADGNATSTPLPVDTNTNASLSWDGENRLIRITKTSGEVINYQYDAMHRRIRKITSGQQEVFVYDGWNLIAEYQTDATLAVQSGKNYTCGMDLSGSMQGAGGVGGLLAVTEVPTSGTGNHYYAMSDGNGNIGTYVDQSGTAVAHYEYDSFGREVVKTGAKSDDFAHRFSTKYTDEESGLLYYGYRYYDPVTGRWPSRDPIEERGGENLYGMVSNAAVNWIDVLGREANIYGYRLRIKLTIGCVCTWTADCVSKGSCGGGKVIKLSYNGSAVDSLDFEAAPDWIFNDFITDLVKESFGLIEQAARTQMMNKVIKLAEAGPPCPEGYDFDKSSKKISCLCRSGLEETLINE